MMLILHRHGGDIELAGYLQNAVGTVSLVLDLRIDHERWGSSTDPTLNGQLHYPNDLHKPLNEVATDKIRKYRADYNNKPPNAISFMPAVARTTGSLHSEFVRILMRISMLPTRSSMRISMLPTRRSSTWVATVASNFCMWVTGPERSSQDFVGTVIHPANGVHSLQLHLQSGYFVLHDSELLRVRVCCR